MACVVCDVCGVLLRHVVLCCRCCGRCRVCCRLFVLGRRVLAVGCWVLVVVPCRLCVVCRVPLAVVVLSAAAVVEAAGIVVW